MTNIPPLTGLIIYTGHTVNLSMCVCYYVLVCVNGLCIKGQFKSNGQDRKMTPRSPHRLVSGNKTGYIQSPSSALRNSLLGKLLVHNHKTEVIFFMVVRKNTVMNLSRTTRLLMFMTPCVTNNYEKFHFISQKWGL